MKHPLFFALLFCMLSGPMLRAQLQVELYGDFQLGIPLDEFDDKLNDLGFGGSGGLLLGLEGTPFQLGVELGGMVFQRRSTDYTLVIEQGPFTEFLDRRFVVKNSAFFGHLVLRAKPPLDFVLQPYLDGMFGFKNFFTRIKLYDTQIPDDKILLDSRSLENDIALSYGGALGVHLDLSGGSGGILIDFRCAFLFGSRLDFLVLDDSMEVLDPDNVEDVLIPRSARTNMILPQIGLHFLFDRMGGPED
jgi:hypothetical protein